ncbi:MAG: DUF4878 domain-containing protein [Candidatus Symbiothrix sp.]|jgi:hypothetical protein|nr:DUF4878 domain-containing protein [Candidatus Symbiothrix sp.]
MKKVMSLFVAAIAVLAVSSCGGGKSPADIEKSIYTQFQKGNYERGLDIYFANIDTGEGETDKEQVKAVAEKIKASATQGFEKKEGIKSFEILEETIAEDGETATVKTKIIAGDGSEDTQTTKYVKRDGKWKIVFGK